MGYGLVVFVGQAVDVAVGWPGLGLRVGVIVADGVGDASKGRGVFDGGRTLVRTVAGCEGCTVLTGVGEGVTDGEPRRKRYAPPSKRINAPRSKPAVRQVSARFHWRLGATGTVATSGIVAGTCKVTIVILS